MSRKEILVVEDEEDILELVRYILAKEGYELRGVLSGEDALNEVKNKLPDMVVLDLMLPGLDGIEVCRELKSNPKTQQLPVVMLTAKGEESDIVAGLELGADERGRQLSSGVYFYRLVAGEYSQTRKMVLLK